MAKGARASSIKTNNSKLKSKVFGPVEDARAERLSAKLLELASQPKPKLEKNYEAVESQVGMFVAPLQLLASNISLGATENHGPVVSEPQDGKTEGKRLFQNFQRPIR